MADEDKTDEDKVGPPESTVGDKAHLAVTASLSAIPLIGGPAAELFSSLIIPPLEKRREEWMLDIAEGLKTLEEQVEGFTAESLVGNEHFVTMVMHASQSAIRNHQKEKLEAFRNAVLNTAIDEDPDVDIQAVFVRIVDALTPWHLHVLKFYQNPETFLAARGIKATMGDYLSQQVSKVFPELADKESFRLQIERDLLDYGLIYREGEWYTRRTTNTGEEFLAYISSPVR